MLKNKKDSLEFVRENGLSVPFTKRITKEGLAKRIQKAIRAKIKQLGVDKATVIGPDLRFFLNNNQKFQKI